MWADALAPFAVVGPAVKDGREAEEDDHCDDDRALPRHSLSTRSGVTRPLVGGSARSPRRSAAVRWPCYRIRYRYPAAEETTRWRT